VSTATEPHVKRASLAGPLTKSIIFVVVTALATAILALSIASTGPNGTVGYNALFTDVTGLTVGSDVDIAGVRIGQVSQIRVVDRNLALVSFSVESGRPLPVAVTATIKYLNLVGQRYINLEQGAGPVDQTLRPGATIPPSTSPTCSTASSPSSRRWPRTRSTSCPVRSSGSCRARARRWAAWSRTSDRSPPLWRPRTR
jgi:ABC-type transporter Mla subunit MlaD